MAYDLRYVVNKVTDGLEQAASTGGNKISLLGGHKEYSDMRKFAREEVARINRVPMDHWDESRSLYFVRLLEDFGGERLCPTEVGQLEVKIWPERERIDFVYDGTLLHDPDSKRFVRSGIGMDYKDGELVQVCNIASPSHFVAKREEWLNDVFSIGMAARPGETYETILNRVIDMFVKQITDFKGSYQG